MNEVRLKSVKYSERVGRPKEWTLDGLTLGSINLIVGMNASGKTRALNVIGNLARQFLPAQRFRPQNCGYDLTFDNRGQLLRYVLFVDDGKVTKEQVYVDDKPRLLRGPGGEGEIFAEEMNQMLKFKPPETEPAAVARRDSLQHPFLEPLHEWALAVRHYYFGTSLGKDVVTLFIKDAPVPDGRNTQQVAAIFRQAEKTHGPKFEDAVRQDMSRMGYDLEEVLLSPPEGVQIVQDGLPREVLGLAVKEQGIEGIIDQNELSQGMFRALSIIIQVNYSQMTGLANCVLIDDIGEGLDFDRSTRLIDLLREKAKDSSFQLVMTTNDRFVMNHVPLEEWLVLRRKDGQVKVLNWENSSGLFEEFKYTGLSNFSFLEMGFADAPTVVKVVKDE